jgi:hypothetical protein
MSLDCVHAEDQVIIKNVVKVIESLKKSKVFTSWSIEPPKNGYYMLYAYINEAVDYDISRAELDLITMVNPLRIVNSGVSRSNGKTKVAIKISDRNEPVLIVETEFVSLRKRMRFDTSSTPTSSAVVSSSAAATTTPSL